MRTPLFALRLLAIVVCAWAPGVFGQAPPADASGIPASIEQLKSPDQRTRLAAADAIAAAGPQAKAAVPELVNMLNSAAPLDRLAAAMALARIGPDAAPALPALRQAEANGDENLKKVARLAIERIDPPLLTILMERVTSPYVLAGLLSLGAGVVAIVALSLRRGGKIPEPVWKEAEIKAKEAREQKAKEKEKAATEKAAAAPPAVTPKPAPKPAAKPAAKPTAAPPADRPGAATPAAADRLPKRRARVSKPLQSLGHYVQEHEEGPESIKRDLIRAQEELKKITDAQQELSELLEKDDLARDPERKRSLRKEIDEYAIEHYRAEVRVKALDVKLLEALVGDGKTSDAELRERSEAALKQKWDDLRALCETPAKIVFKSGQWTSVPTGPTASIPDLRARLHDFDVSLPERSTEEPTSA